MVNPVNNNIPTDYQPSAGRTVKVDNNEHFNLNNALNEQKQAQDGVIYEPSEKKDSASLSGSSGKDTGYSTQGKDTFESSLDKAKKKQEQIDTNNSAFRKSLKELWHNISNFFAGLWFNIKKIFGNVWESKPLAEGVESMRRDSSASSLSEELPPSNDNFLSNENAHFNEGSHSANYSKSDVTETSSIDALEASRDTKIRKALSEGNRDEFRSLISDDGKRQPARNTSMLTTYDSSGQLVNINPSDENKILHGDRHTTKL